MNNTIDYQECLYSKSIQLCKNIQKELINLEKELENIKNKDKKKPIPPAGIPSYRIELNNNPNIHWASSLRH